MILARVFRIGKDMLRPKLSANVLVGGVAMDGTGLVSAAFTMIDLEAGTTKIDHVAAAIITSNPLVIEYTWVTGDTDTAGRYSSYITGYWSASSGTPEDFTGPEVLVYLPGDRLVY